MTEAAAGLPTSSSVSTVRLDGSDIGAVAVYQLKRGSSASATFRNQYVVQLVHAATGSGSSPRFVRADGHVVALSTGARAVAAWFEGDRVVVVLRDAKKPELASLAAAIRATPVTG